MSIQITLETERLRLEAPPYSTLQGAIYSRLSPHLFKQVHDIGFHHPYKHKKVFRLFSISPVFSYACEPEISTANKVTALNYKGNIHFYVSSIINSLILDLKENIEKHGITFGNKTYKAHCKIIDLPQEIDNCKEIVALLKVYDLLITKKTENGTKEDVDFFSPDFEEIIYSSLNEKFQTALHHSLIKPFDLNFKIIEKKLLKSFVTRLRKNQETYKIYTCNLIIKTNPESLNFVFNTGLGRKNTQCMGFVDILMAYTSQT